MVRTTEEVRCEAIQNGCGSCAGTYDLGPGYGRGDCL